MACVRGRLRWAAAAAVLVLSGAGCGTEPVPPEYYPTTEGANTQAGQIKIRNVSILGPAPTAAAAAGSSASVYFSLINAGRVEDTLVQVGAEGVATSVSMSQPEVRVPPLGLVWVGTGPYTVTLQGLKRPLTVGQYVTLRMRFKQAGEVTVRGVPVQSAAVASSLPNPSVSAPSPSPSPTPTASPTPSPTPSPILSPSPTS
ncbi:copper chaperone PCu(A)C [Microtetraspora fusca]|uniref:Copper chaperone PCu(A)C n=1 Tax=Microtetraspora fusca TaxID=1997 RepID=A0ABW6VD23_MICFU